MTVAEQLIGFLQKNPNIPYCDDCLQRKIALIQKAVLRQAMNSLQQKSGFTRAYGTCRQCGQATAVILFCRSVLPDSGSMGVAEKSAPLRPDTVGRTRNGLTE